MELTVPKIIGFEMYKENFKKFEDCLVRRVAKRYSKQLVNMHSFYVTNYIHKGVVKTAFFMIEIILSVFSIPLLIIKMGKFKKK